MPKPTKMTENSKKVFFYLKEHGGEFTKHQLSRDSGIPLSCVTGSVSGLIRKGYAAERIEEVPNPDVGKKPLYVRYISLTEAGTKFNPIEFEAQQERDYQQQKIDKAKARLIAKKQRLLQNLEAQRQQLEDMASTVLAEKEEKEKEKESNPDKSSDEIDSSEFLNTNNIN